MYVFCLIVQYVMVHTHCMPSLPLYSIRFWSYQSEGGHTVYSVVKVCVSD